MDTVQESGGRSLAVLGGALLTPEPAPGTSGVLVAGGRIVRLLRSAQEVPAGAAVLDLRPHLLCPGFIDVHTHGGWGLRFADSPEAARQILRRRAASGTTGLLLTVGGGPEQLAALRRVVEQPPADGAAALGFHIEGPWLNWDAWVAWGARPSSGRPLVPPHPDDFFRMQEAAGGAIRLVSVAPEFPDALPFISRLAESGVVVSIGHTTAPPELARAAVDAGARHATHTFNGMQPMHHRNPGAAAVVLTERRIVAELIADGAHVHPLFQQLLVRAKGPDRVALVTDGARLAGSPPGEYRDGERTLYVREDFGVWTEHGALAGSASPLDRNIAYLTAQADVSLAEAVQMASTVPARQLGLEERKGHLRPGADADIAVLNAARRCVCTLVGGRVVWRLEGEPPDWAAWPPVWGPYAPGGAHA